MKNDPYSLTVAIPTYNRPQTLEKIIKQLSKEKENFKILISDDCSPDNGSTERMVKSHQKTMPNLYFHRNEKNLGYSGNVCELYEMVDTNYIWFLCDDDTVLPGAIKKIKASLAQYNPAVAIFNYEQKDPYGTDVVAGVQKTKGYTKMADIDDYQPLQRLTFLSIIVLKKKYSISEIKKRNYTNNIFFQITLSLYLLSKEFRYYEVAETILKRNVGYKYGEFFKFYLVDHLKAVEIVDTKFELEKFIIWSKKHLSTSLKLYLSQNLGLYIYNGEPTEETKNYIKRYYGPIYSRFIFSFKLLKIITPTFLLKTILIITLIRIHGTEKGMKIYRDNINRAYKDDRKTDFVNYK